MRAKDPSTRKNVLLISKVPSKAIKELLTLRRDFISLEEPDSDYEKTCKLMSKKKCALCIESTPNKIVLTRTFDFEPLERIEFRILKSMSSSDFTTVPAELFSKYFLICQNVENKRLENLFIDFFNQPSTKINIDAVRYAWIISERQEDVRIITVKYVRVLNDFSVEDVGPFFELEVTKEFFCGDELYEKAFSQHKAKKQKNVKTNVFKDKIGKLHIERQDLNDINHKKSRAYKKTLNN